MSGFVDLQVNGYVGVDFNGETLTEDDAIVVSEKLIADGVSSALVTIITAPLESMIRRIARVAELIDTMPPFANVIAGIHVEGPFINAAEGYVGAHPASSRHPGDTGTAERLLDAGGGHVKLVTLAPEMDRACDVTKSLTDRGIVVAAGHCDASLDQLNESIDAGLALFTHLGNGCPGPDASPRQHHPTGVEHCPIVCGFPSSPTVITFRRSL